MSVIGSLGMAWSRLDPMGAPRVTKPSVLAITPDDRFYSSLLYVSTDLGWTANWARCIEYALDTLDRQEREPVVLYDYHSPSEPWHIAARKLIAAKQQCCIVMAAPYVDQQLWDLAMQHEIYDVVARTGPAAHLAATLRFAWKWKSGGEARLRVLAPGIRSGIPQRVQQMSSSIWTP